VDNQHYYLWAKAHCPYCSEAQTILLQKARSHTVYVMDNDLEDLEKIKEKYNHFTVPIVVSRENDEDTFIGGCSELKKWLNDGEEK